MICDRSDGVNPNRAPHRCTAASASFHTSHHGDRTSRKPCCWPLRQTPAGRSPHRRRQAALQLGHDGPPHRNRTRRASASHPVSTCRSCRSLASPSQTTRASSPNQSGGAGHPVIDGTIAGAGSFPRSTRNGRGLGCGPRLPTLGTPLGRRSRKPWRERFHPGRGPRFFGRFGGPCPHPSGSGMRRLQ